MAYPSCSPPRAQGVKPHTRAAPGRRRKRAKPTGGYWTCVNERTGRTCGTHHRTLSAATRHERKLNLVSYRRGAGRPWDAEKRG